MIVVVCRDRDRCLHVTHIGASLKHMKYHSCFEIQYILDFIRI